VLFITFIRKKRVSSVCKYQHYGHYTKQMYSVCWNFWLRSYVLRLISDATQST